jgi:hypothetical protein
MTYNQRVPKKDFAQLALSIVEKVTRDGTAKAESRKKGRAGGLKGGKARAKALTDTQREEIARVAATARWKKKKR